MKNVSLPVTWVNKRQMNGVTRIGSIQFLRHNKKTGETGTGRKIGNWIVEIEMNDLRGQIVVIVGLPEIRGHLETLLEKISK